jgi:hypothetical protein
MAIRWAFSKKSRERHYLVDFDAIGYHFYDSAIKSKDGRGGCQEEISLYLTKDTAEGYGVPQ